MVPRKRANSATRRALSTNSHVVARPVDDVVTTTLTRLPEEIRQNILARVPLPLLFPFIDLRDKRFSQTFENACRNNDIYPVFGRHTPWSLEFHRFLSSLEDAELFQGREQISFTEREIIETLPMNGGRLLYLHYTPGGRPGVRRVLNFKLQVPKTHRAGIHRSYRLLEYRFAHRDDVGFYEFVLGNKHDRVVHAAEEMTCIENTVEVDRFVTCIPFDENCSLYYCRHFKTHCNVYRQSLTANSRPELVWTLAEPGILSSISVSNQKLFFFAMIGQKSHILCYDMTSKKLHSMRAVDVDLRCEELAHNNSLLLSNEDMHTCIYTLRDHGLQLRVIPTLRRHRFNKDTYLILKEEEGKVALKTLSLIDDEPVERFVMFCSRWCVCRRWGDNFFYVLEANHRYIWYQERPADPPFLVYEDARQTIMERVRRLSMLSSTFWARKRQHSV